MFYHYYNAYLPEDITALSDLTAFIEPMAMYGDRMLTVTHVLTKLGIRQLADYNREYLDRNPYGNLELLITGLDAVSPDIIKRYYINHFHLYYSCWGNNPLLHDDRFYVQTYTKEEVNNQALVGIYDVMPWYPTGVLFVKLPNGKVTMLCDFPDITARAISRASRILSYNDVGGIWSEYDAKLMNGLVERCKEIYPFELDERLNRSFLSTQPETSHLFRPNGGHPFDLFHPERGGVESSRILDAIAKKVFDEPWIMGIKQEHYRANLKLKAYKPPEQVNKIPGKDNECVNHPIFQINGKL